jgi:hypothetical protein
MTGVLDDRARSHHDPGKRRISAFARVLFCAR